MAKTLKKIVITITALLILFVILIIACISPIAKYLVEKNSVKYLGRVIKMDRLYLNPFTGYVHISHLRAYEANSDSLFLTAEGVSAKYEIFKTFHKTYEISSISLERPVGYIIQDKKQLNFSDLIERFRHKGIRDTAIHKPPVHFNILNIKVIDGEFHYIAQSIPVNYFIKHVNIESTGKWWNVDSMIIKFAVSSGPASGDIKGTGAIIFSNVKYSLDATFNKFDLSLLQQYLHGLANYGHLSAILDGHVKGTGSFKDGLDLDASCFIAISNFHFGKDAANDFASFDKLVIAAQKVSPRRNYYNLDSISIVHPYFKYEKYNKLDNLQKMFGEGGSRIKQADAASKEGNFNVIIELAKYLKKLGQSFLSSYYKAGRIAIYNGDLKFNDYSLRSKFSIAAFPLNLFADSIDRNNQRFMVFLTSGIKPYGNLDISLSLDPNDNGYFDMHYKILKVPVSIFNPYLVNYTSFSLDRGTFEFTGAMHVEDSIINSENHILIIDPHVGMHIQNEGIKWIPIPLIMWLVRSAGDAIDLQIPIRGDLSKPRFKFGKAIATIIGNIFIKPPSTLYLIHVNKVQQVLDKSLNITWQTGQTQLKPLQEKFILQMVVFLHANPKAVITVSSFPYYEIETENILLFEAKRKYFLYTHYTSNNYLSQNDSLYVDRMSIKDSSFIHYLDEQVKDSMIFTTQEKCSHIISRQLVEKRYKELLSNRENIFKSYFANATGQVNFIQTGNVIPFNGFSYYKIDYQGEIPKRLLNAYSEMEQLNNKAPRKKYLKERKTEINAGR